MGMFADKTLKCLECGQDFIYAATEQELHQSLGYQNEPKRCTPCREAKRQRKGSGAPRGGGAAAGGGGREAGGGSAKEFFTAICGECGKEAQLPFKPRGDRPVFCSECFTKRRTPM